MTSKRDSVAETIKEVGLFASELQSGDGVFLLCQILNYGTLVL